MTDNEIIKALECCSNAEPCSNCPYQKQCDETDLAEIALDLINRQKAEIERLNKEVDRLSQCVLYHDGQITDAIKEFAERFEKEAENVGIDSEGDFLYSDSDNTAFEIYNTVAEWCKEVANTILKEMAGDTE